MDILLGIATTLHLGLSGDYNGFHPQIRFEEQQYVAGAYYNSEENISSYLGYDFDLDYFDLEIGVVTGYDAIGAVIPYARVTKDFGDRTIFLAPVGENINGELNTGLVFGFEFYLNK